LKPKVMLIDPTIRPEGVELLKKSCEVYTAPNGDEKTLIEYVGKGADALITRMTPVTKAVIEAGKNLKVIGRPGVGVDNIDIQTATERNISIINVPAGNALSVAEHVIALMLALAKMVRKGDEAVRGRDWMFRDRELPIEISNKNLYLLGFGNNARITARMAQNAFDMKVRAYDPFVDRKTFQESNVRVIEDIDSGFEGADFVSVHLPLTTSTRHMIGAKQFKLMEGAYFINCSRGGIVSTDDLVNSLNSGLLKGAGVDVYEEEPPSKTNKLLYCKNAILTPHYAGDTIEAKTRCALILVENVIKQLSGEKADGIVNFKH
jgi:D-3-phosphoglycerate dehydrogenase